MRKRSYQRHREEIYERDGHRCVYCGTESDLTIDHKIPVKLGGQHCVSNLVTACRSCNARKGARLSIDLKRAVGIEEVMSPVEKHGRANEVAHMRQEIESLRSRLAVATMLRDSAIELLGSQQKLYADLLKKVWPRENPPKESASSGGLEFSGFQDGSFNFGDWFK